MRSGGKVGKGLKVKVFGVMRANMLGSLLFESAQTAQLRCNVQVKAGVRGCARAGMNL